MRDLILLLRRLPGQILRRLGLWRATLWHRAHLGQVGAGSRFQPGVRFDDPGAVQIGAGCYIWRGVAVSAETGRAGLRIGDGVQINRDVHLDTTGGLVIGDDTLISEAAVIYTHDHGLHPWSVPEPMVKTIGTGVWIGLRAVILPQCRRIGDHAVIGAGSVVTRDVPAGAVVAGNPARIIGQRAKVAA
ncbi:acyltransferase [Yoonia vestfoldensis]|uniref:Maltose O-acetyltransferase n=1 Tax=Yoonia vestfoldensis TaxID=245188 RepID=A0A1Y0EDA2_9RHOB|nr:acyltransferase [Yoonia vestfoldensis]ARU01554.1 maltose O-acetyltransferase [Yoonia vestfoldensis]